MESLRSFSLEPELSDEVFALFSNLIYRTSGIRLGLQKKGLLISRLSRRLLALRINSFYNYFKRVRENEDELAWMLDCISTNTTKFFRECHHFEYLRGSIIPELIRSKPDRTIRVWSAGCSTGEEPYSIAITIFEALRDEGLSPMGWDIKILATDISNRVLQIGKRGVYEMDQLPPALPQDVLTRYFLKGVGRNEGKVKVKDPLREVVRFGRLNLKDPTYPFRKRFDIIFCRNVMIYFDEEMKRHVISNLRHHLAESGYLFLGHSETIFGDGGFVPVSTTVYRKV